MPRGTHVAGRVLNGVRAEVVAASGVRPERTVLHLHGGGYCIGSPRMTRAWAAHLSAQAACRVVVPEYRLAPADPHPLRLRSQARRGLDESDERSFNSAWRRHLPRRVPRPA